MNEHRGVWRGKRVDNGEWITGLLAYRSCGLDDTPAAEIYIEKDYESYWVDPSTLGECTGLRDKNGKVIFEGDLLSNKLPEPEIFRCYYGSEQAGFYAENVSTHSVYVWGAFLDMTLFKMEIIGNIHDNPELLKGEDDE